MSGRKGGGFGWPKLDAMSGEVGQEWTRRGDEGEKTR